MNELLTVCKRVFKHNLLGLTTKRDINKKVVAKRNQIPMERDQISPSALRPFRVSVEGNIGAGKTTLINHISRQPAVEIYLEPIDWWQNLDGYNLLNLLYNDVDKWYIVFQKYVQLTRLKVQTTKPKQSTTTQIFERSLQNNRYCFLEQAKSSGYLKPPDYEVFQQWYQWIQENIDIDIDLIVYLRTNPEVVYERMKNRGRMEEIDVPLDYIKSLHESHEKWLLCNNNNIKLDQLIIIDANKPLDIVLQQCDENMKRIVKENRIKKTRFTSLFNY